MLTWIRTNVFVILLGLLCVLSSVAAMAIAFRPAESGDITHATGLAMMLKYFTALAAASFWFVFLRISDAVAGIKFKESYAQIEANGIAMAIYFGLRSLSVGVLLGMLLG